jgi:hypothetical protein
VDRAPPNSYSTHQRLDDDSGTDSFQARKSIDPYLQKSPDSPSLLALTCIPASSPALLGMEAQCKSRLDSCSLHKALDDNLYQETPHCHRQSK